MTELDIEYEKEVCKQLLEISRLIYATSSTHSLPLPEEVMKRKENTSLEGIRIQISENICFIRMAYKYLLLDLESTQREKGNASD